MGLDFSSGGPTLGLIGEESVNLGDGTVEGHDSEAVVSNVENQVLAHDGQTDETEVSTGFRLRRKTGSNAGQARTVVSPTFGQLTVAQEQRWRRGNRAGSIAGGRIDMLGLH